MKIYKQLDATPHIQLEEGTYSGYQIETESYIFDFDIEIEDTFQEVAGTEFAPATSELVGRSVSIENLTVWNKDIEENVLHPMQLLIDKIKSKFR